MLTLKQEFHISFIDVKLRTEMFSLSKTEYLPKLKLYMGVHFPKLFIKMYIFDK